MKYLSNTLILFGFLFFNAFHSSAQLSSAALEYSATLDSLSVPTALWLESTFDDISDLGGVQISAYDAVTGQFIKEYQATRSELIASGYLTSEHLYFQLLDILEGQQYRIQMNAYTIDGAYIEMQELTTTL